VARQEHTDITLAPMTEALLAFAAPRLGERVLDIAGRVPIGAQHVRMRFMRASSKRTSRIAVIGAARMQERATAAIYGPRVIGGERHDVTRHARWRAAIS
jgi:hypothetical protein